MEHSVVIRSATKDDAANVFGLIKELAAYEKLESQVTLKEKQFMEDGFRSEKFYDCVVAERMSQECTELIGYGVFFFMFSPIVGRYLYLEDFYVCPQHRHGGIGTKILKKIASVAVENGCSQADFTVLAWNKPSIHYYEKLHAVNVTQTSHEHFCRFEHISSDN